MRRRKRHVRDAPIVEYRGAACGRRIGMCGYRSVPTDALVDASAYQPIVAVYRIEGQGEQTCHISILKVIVQKSQTGYTDTQTGPINALPEPLKGQ